jgi:amino acid transporter
LIFWAFLGWENLGFGVQEIRNPRRSVPLIFALSFVLVTILFLLPAFTSIGAAVRGSQEIFGTAGLVSLLEGSMLKPICALVLTVLIVGNANAWMYTVSRMLFAEAKEGVLPRCLARLSQRHVPERCLHFCYLAVAIGIAVCWLPI